jgi:hypothetical protein
MPASKQKIAPTLAQDGWTPSQGKPAVQGGYVPTINQTTATPPTGGSAVKPPEKK